MKPVRAIFHRKPDRIVTDEVQVEKGNTLVRFDVPSFFSKTL